MYKVFPSKRSTLGLSFTPTFFTPHLFIQLVELFFNARRKEIFMIAKLVAVICSTTPFSLNVQLFLVFTFLDGLKCALIGYFEKLKLPSNKRLFFLVT